MKSIRYPLISFGDWINITFCRKKFLIFNLPCLAGLNAQMNKYRLAHLPGSQLVFGILPDGKVIRLLVCQVFKDDVHNVFEVLIILPDFHGIDHFYQGGEILLFNGSLIMDLPDEGGIEQRLCLYPEIIAGLSFTLGVGDQSRYELLCLRHGMSDGDSLACLSPVQENPNDIALSRYGIRTKASK